VFNRKTNRNLSMRSGSLHASTQKVHRSCFPIHFDIRNIYSKFAWKADFLALGVCFPQTKLERWPHLCRVKIMFSLLPTNCVVSATMNSIKCIGNWTPLRICVRSKNTQPYLKVRLIIYRTNADSQWNPVYNAAFHRICCYRNETICR